MPEELKGHRADEKEAYDYTLRDFDTCLSCPVCRAKELRDGIGEPVSFYCNGQLKACNVVLSVGKHECEQHKGKKQAEVKPHEV